MALPLEAPSGYDLSMAIIEDVTCGKDKTLVKIYGTWFLKAEHGSFPQHPDGSHNSWRALPESSTIITGTALTAGFPQLLTFRVGKCCVCVCVCVWGVCPVHCRVFGSIPGLHSPETTSIYPFFQF